MRRWLFNLAAAMSLVMGLAIGVLWVRSYWAADWLAVQSPSHAYGLASSGGTLCGERCAPIPPFTYFPTRPFHASLSPIDLGHAKPVGLKRDLRLLGIGATLVEKRDEHRYAVMLPHWLLMLLCLLPVLGWLFLNRNRRRLHRLAAGLCVTCGYDLRATPDRCPECGAVPRDLKTAGPQLSRTG